MAAAKSSKSERYHLPDGSRSTRSPWVWRGFFFMSLVGLGLAISLFSAGNTTFGALWVVITVGWFSVAMWLWRQTMKPENT